MNQLKQSLGIMYYLKQTITEKLEFIISNCTDDHQDEHSAKIYMEQAHFDTFRRMMILDACSFLEEYNEFFGVKTEEEYKARILVVKQVCKPFTTRIRQWKDIKTYRNTVLAHTMRNKNNEFVLIDRSINQLNAPNTTLDYIMLQASIETIMTIIEQEFYSELKECLSELNKMDYSAPSKSGINYDNFELIWSSMVLESTILTKQGGRNYLYLRPTFCDKLEEKINALS